MTRTTRIRSIRRAALAAVCMACVRTTQFDRYLASQQWSDAAREFAGDSSLANNDTELFRAAMLFGTPGRPTYDPQRAHDLLRTLVTRFPESSHREAAYTQLSLVDETLRAGRDAESQRHELEARIAELTRSLNALRGRVDSTGVQNDSLRASVQRLEAELRDRDEQLRALRSELQRLKEIDLKRPPGSPIKP